MKGALLHDPFLTCLTCVSHLPPATLNSKACQAYALETCSVRGERRLQVYLCMPVILQSVRASSGPDVMVLDGC